MKLALSFGLLFVLQFNFLQAQNNPDSIKQEQAKAFSCWAQAGLGFSGAKFQESKVGLLFGVGTTLKSGDNLFSFRYNTNSEMNILGPNPPGEIWTFEALYGRSFAFSTKRLIFPPLLPLGLLFKGNFKYLFNVSAGISYVGIKERTAIIHSETFNTLYSSGKRYRFGVPLEMELINITSKYFAAGTGVYYNINGRRNFLGGRVNLYFGIF